MIVLPLLAESTINNLRKIVYARQVARTAVLKYVAFAEYVSISSWRE